MLVVFGTFLALLELPHSYLTPGPRDDYYDFMKKPKPTNWWLQGYWTAMKAEKRSDLANEITRTGDTSEFERKMFLTGWNSAWDCERRGE